MARDRYEGKRRQALENKRDMWIWEVLEVLRIVIEREQRGENFLYLHVRPTVLPMCPVRSVSCMYVLQF
jgi:hypothetical protein